MRFGCCVPLDDVAVVESHGYDYFEPVVGTLMPEASEADFAPVRRKMENLSIRPEAFNVFIPGQIPLVGPHVDRERFTRYVTVATRRAAEVGGKVIVFGSGRARNVPEGFDRTRARQQLVDFLVVTGEAAARAGVTIAIEPLNRGECNIINSVEEGLELAREIGTESVKVLVDNYHALLEKEPFDNIVRARSWLAHVHVSDPSRLYPGSSDYDYTEFLASLHRAGYNQRISVECRWSDFPAESVVALELLRRIWDSQ